MSNILGEAILRRPSQGRSEKHVGDRQEVGEEVYTELKLDMMKL